MELPSSGSLVHKLLISATENLLRTSSGRNVRTSPDGGQTAPGGICGGGGWRRRAVAEPVAERDESVNGPVNETESQSQPDSEDSDLT